MTVTITIPHRLWGNRGECRIHARGARMLGFMACVLVAGLAWPGLMWGFGEVERCVKIKHRGEPEKGTGCLDQRLWNFFVIFCLEL